MDGSPQPKLSWYKGDGSHELSTANSTVTPYSMSSLQLKVTREDNDREYRFESSDGRDL
jgi:hypothetical protein